MTPSPIPDGTPIELRYNRPDQGDVWTTVRANANGSFDMPELVQMYDCIVICKGTTLVGEDLSLTTPSVEIGEVTGVEDNGNTRFTWRVTQMPTSGQLWLIINMNIDFEKNVQWPE